jgi:hypothetical protein
LPGWWMPWMKSGHDKRTESAAGIDALDPSS